MSLGIYEVLFILLEFFLNFEIQIFGKKLNVFKNISKIRKDLRIINSIKSIFFVNFWNSKIWIFLFRFLKKIYFYEFSFFEFPVFYWKFYLDAAFVVLKCNSHHFKQKKRMLLIFAVFFSLENLILKLLFAA